jgi:hypothetical protein
MGGPPAGGKHHVLTISMQYSIKEPSVPKRTPLFDRLVQSVVQNLLLNEQTGESIDYFDVAKFVVRQHISTPAQAHRIIKEMMIRHPLIVPALLQTDRLLHTWMDLAQELTWQEVAREVSKLPQVSAIVRKQHANSLADAIERAFVKKR